MNKRVLKFVGVLALVLVLTACTSAATPAGPSVVTQIVNGTPQVITATTAPTLNPYDENAPITVWIDQDRQPYIDAYKKANPDKASLINSVIVDREQFPAKVLLFNNTGQGWPDVVFAEPRLVARVADAAHQFPLDLKQWIPADTLNNYDGMANCTFGDKVYCVRNDLAQYVLYYNKTAHGQVRLPGAHYMGGLSGPQRQGRRGTSGLPDGHARRRLELALLLR